MTMIRFAYVALAGVAPQCGHFMAPPSMSLPQEEQGTSIRKREHVGGVGGKRNGCAVGSGRRK